MNTKERSCSVEVLEVIDRVGFVTELSAEMIEGFRSAEERAFGNWVVDAVKARLLEGFSYEAVKFPLVNDAVVSEHVVLKSGREKTEIRHIHRSEGYTPDFVLYLTKDGEQSFRKAGLFRKAFLVMRQGSSVEGCGIADDMNFIVVDVKGGFSPHQRDERYFSLVRKLVLGRHNFWVEKVVPGKFLIKAWLPESDRWMKNRKVATLNKMGKICPTLAGFLEKVGLSMTQELF